MSQSTKGLEEQLIGPNKTIDWNYYFSASIRLHLNKVADEIKFKMNEILIQRGILVPKVEGGKFGIISDGSDLCQSPALNGGPGCGLYFRFRPDAFDYLATAQKHGFFKKDSFVFLICTANGKKETK
jgi:hypothetical protein